MTQVILVLSDRAATVLRNHCSGHDISQDIDVLAAVNAEIDSQLHRNGQRAHEQTAVVTTAAEIAQQVAAAGKKAVTS